MAINSEENIKIEEVTRLVRNVQKVVQDMKNEVESHPLVPNAIFDELFEALDSVNQILEPRRPTVCYCMGGTDAGKTTIISKISGIKMSHISHDHNPGTSTFESIPVPDVNTVFVDTVGFGANSNGSSLMKTFKTTMESIHRPDAILVIVTKTQLRLMESFKLIMTDINKVLKCLKSERSGKPIPVICVLNKIDDYFEGNLPTSEDDKKTLERTSTNVLKLINQHLVTPARKCVPIAARMNYGIDQLRLELNADSPLNAQIIDNNLDYFKQSRLSIANKIIAAFSIASAAVSFFPFVDIVITTVFQEWMYRMLACFSVDPSRTSESFKAVHRTTQLAGFAMRGAALLVGGIFQLTIVGYLIGAGICVTASAGTTAGFGWAAYFYFVGQAKDT